MRASVILPTSLLGKVDNPFHICYGETALLNEVYCNYFKAQKGIRAIILDWSYLWPRRKPDLLQLEESIIKVAADSVILPSISYSWKATVDVAQTFTKICKPKVKFIGTLEGYSLDTLRLCYREIRKLSNLICLPSTLEKVARREEIIRDLRIKESVLYLEVLKDPFEEMPPKDSIGICTSLPIRLAADYRRLEEFKPYAPPIDFVGGKPIDEELAIANSLSYKEAVKRGRPNYSL